MQTEPPQGTVPFDDPLPDQSNASIAAEPEAEVEPAPSFAPGLRPLALIPHAGQEPPVDLTDDDASAAWIAATALWHPAILAKSEMLPRIQDVADAASPEPRDLTLIAAGSADRYPSGYRTHAADAGATIVDGLLDRAATIAAVIERAAVGEVAVSPEGTDLIPDFLALGAATWWLVDLTIGMGHSDTLDRDALTRETLTAARSWHEGDTPAAKNRLRAAFEVLTQAREKIYPVDAYLLDLCLLDPLSRPEELADALAARSPFTLLAPARAIENVAERDPDRIAALRTAVDEGWADIVGGAYTEVDEPLLPLTSVLWQFRKAGQVYREHLDGRNVETLARRRFGLYPQLPQFARRFGFRFALHLGFDTGRFPIRPEMKRLWEAPDGSTLETLNRPPIAADRPSEGVRLPWRIARSMKDDFTATLPVVHWAGRFAGWFGDLRKALSYSPVLMRQTTVNDFFHLTDRPFDAFKVSVDEYVTPYLDQAVRRGDPTPISGRVDQTRLRARLDAVEATKALAQALQQGVEGSPADLNTIETAIETGRRGEAIGPLDQAEADWSHALARGMVGTSSEGRPGYLIVNPVGVARRVSVLLPDAELDLRPEGPLRAAQFTDEGVWAVVDLAAFGYAWVPRKTPIDAPLAKLDALTVRDRTLQNESMSVSLDPTTGGIRGIHGMNEPTARLGQQLVIVGLNGPDGKPALSKMKESKFEPEYGGPALLQATTSGVLHHPGDDRPLVAYTQRHRLWSGRTTLEIEATFSILDSAWHDSMGKSDPWTHYLACRWAWPDPESTLKRSAFLASESTDVDRPETPDAIDITSRRRRTSLLFGGLAHHRRIRPRMLDTILIAGKEQARTFRLGVALDLENSWHAATDSLAPAFVVPTDAGPPKTGPAGWLLAVDNKSVAIVAVSYLDHSGDGRGWGLSVTLLETSGRATRCKLRTFRDPTWARQLDFNDEVIVDLTMDGDSVMIDLTPHELARVDVTLS
jgi:alpha-mannosidase